MGKNIERKSIEFFARATFELLKGRHGVPKDDILLGLSVRKDCAKMNDNIFHAFCTGYVERA